MKYVRAKTSARGTKSSHLSGAIFLFSGLFLLRISSLSEFCGGRFKVFFVIPVYIICLRSIRLSRISSKNSPQILDTKGLVRTFPNTAFQILTRIKRILSITNAVNKRVLCRCAVQT